MGQVLVLGLISGGIYALFAIGVVLVYRGTRVLTFAQGEIGTISLYLAYWIVAVEGMPWSVGALAAVALAGGLGATFQVAIVRRMVTSDPVSTAVATVGLLLFLLALEFYLFGGSPRNLPPPTRDAWHVAGVYITYTQLAALAVAAALAFGLQSLLRRTDFGLGILAAAQDPDAVELVGVPLSRVSVAIWSAGAAVSGIAALLVEPTVGVVTPGYASELFVVGLAAAVIGGLSSLPGAFVGGIALGLCESASTRWLSSLGLPGLRYVVVLVVLLAALLARTAWPSLRRATAPAAPAAAEASA